MKIAHIENGLADGSIPFKYDRLMSAMKPGHPADILDDIFCEIGDAVYLGQDVSKEQLLAMLTKLESFQGTFKVDMKEPIRELKIHLE